MKRLLSIVLAACLLIGTLPPVCAMGDDTPRPTVPSSGPCGPNARYDIVDGVMTVSGTGPVTNLGSFDVYRGELTKVVIEEGITALTGNSDLSFRWSIAEVEFPSTLRYVGHVAFVSTSWKNGLTEEFVIVGDGILIDYNGPGGEVIVPDTVKLITCTAFDDAEVTNLIIGSSVKYLGDGRFGVGVQKITVDGQECDVSEATKARSPWVEIERYKDDRGYSICNRFLVMDGVLLASEAADAATVPDAVCAIGPYGLHSNFKELIIPDSVTEIAPNAIRGRTGDYDDGQLVLVRASAGSAVQTYIEDHPDGRLRFLPNGADNSSLLNFTRQEEFYSSKFIDVKEEDWFHADVGIAYELGLMIGKSTDTYGHTAFDPGGQIKVSETVTVAARVRDTYYDGQTDFTAGEGVLWYRPYVDYALEHGIIAAAPDSWDRPATRAEFAAMLAAALPEKELEAIHGDMAFTDLEESHPAYAAVMVLARAGVMQGKGEGRFDPDAPVKRSEAAAMLSRCVLPGQRIQPDDPDQPEPPQEELPVRETPLAAGYQDYYAIRKDGSLVMWGRPEFGPIEEDIPYRQALKLLDNAAGVYTSGRGETLAVDRDGALWSINSTRFSSLVPGLEPDTENPMAPVKVMDGVSMAAMTQFHSVILKRDGSVWVQGFGGFGAPWLMETQPYISKVMDGAVEVGVTAWGGWAITTDHELWAWGVDAGDSAQPKKLLDGVLGVCDLVTVLAANGNGLVRWHDGYSACGVMLSGADRCGRGYAIREDGSLWIDSVGWNGLLYEGPTPFCHVMERVAYAAQGETAMLVLDQDGGLWLLTLEEDSGKVVQTPLQAD